MGLGLLMVSFIAGILETLEKAEFLIVGWTLSIEGTSRLALSILGIIGEVFMLTSIYLVMPLVRVTPRHALMGGITATGLWEITRRILVWYYSVLSMVNLIYGSLATAVVALLSIEALAIILLLGAQVIAELEPKPDDSADENGSGFKP